MPLFLLRTVDGPDAVAVRQRHGAAHLAYFRKAGRTRIAGPILGETAGSLVIFEATDLADAQAFVMDEPYRRAGMYRSIELVPFTLSYLAVNGIASAAGSASNDA